MQLHHLTLFWGRISSRGLRSGVVKSSRDLHSFRALLENSLLIWPDWIVWTPQRVGICLALDNWCQLSYLQFFTPLQLNSSLPSPLDWAPLLRSCSQGPWLAMSPWGVTYSRSHARRLCFWLHKQQGCAILQRPWVSSTSKIVSYCKAEECMGTNVITFCGCHNVLWIRKM